jgi:hypothetical protein
MNQTASRVTEDKMFTINNNIVLLAIFVTKDWQRYFKNMVIIVYIVGKNTRILMPDYVRLESLIMPFMIVKYEAY